MVIKELGGSHDVDSTASQIEPSMTQKKREAENWFCDLRDQICTVFEGIENEETKLMVQLAGLCVNHGSVMAVVGVR